MITCFGVAWCLEPACLGAQLVLVALSEKYYVDIYLLCELPED